MKRESLDERLNKLPKLRERIEKIIEIAEGDHTGTRTADAVEEQLIEETRKLGREVLTSWAGETVRSSIGQYLT